MKIKLLFLPALAAGLLIPSAASASFHLMKVSEVYPGSVAVADAQFIELQMYSAGHNFVAGHTVTASGPGGGEDYTFGSSVPNGQSQRTILLATKEAEAAFGVKADLLIEKLVLDRSSGSVCFDAIDCVAWGAGAGALPSPAGTNAAAIPDGMSLTRRIEPGCKTLLENADDTNGSAADFRAATPTPRANATPPKEVECDTEVSGASLQAKSQQKGSATRPKIAVKAGLGEAGEVKVVAKAEAGRKTYKLSETASLDSGETKKIKLVAAGKAKRKIGAALERGKVKVSLVGKFSDEAGNKTTEKTKTKLK